jgi:hypothetical protein
VQHCVVPYSDTAGTEHSGEVGADSLLEAAALGLAAFKNSGYGPGPTSTLTVKVMPPCVCHTLKVQRVLDWLNGGARSPREVLLKRRLSGEGV